MMNLNDYQLEATKTAIYSSTNDDPFQETREKIPGLAYTVLGLVGEAGEVANLVKKIYRDNLFNKEKIAEELGDVLWYIAMTAHELDYSLEDIAQANVEKLRKRHLT